MNKILLYGVPDTFLSLLMIVEFRLWGYDKGMLLFDGMLDNGKAFKTMHVFLCLN
jgi:hypothetical protein